MLQGRSSGVQGALIVTHVIILMADRAHGEAVHIALASLPLQLAYCHLTAYSSYGNNAVCTIKSHPL